MQMWGIEMIEKPKDVEKYFENSKCKICGVVVQPHFQGNTKLPKEEHLAKEHQDLEWMIMKKSTKESLRLILEDLLDIFRRPSRHYGD